MFISKMDPLPLNSACRVRSPPPSPTCTVKCRSAYYVEKSLHDDVSPSGIWICASHLVCCHRADPTVCFIMKFKRFLGIAFPKGLILFSRFFSSRSFFFFSFVGGVSPFPVEVGLKTLCWLKCICCSPLLRITNRIRDEKYDINIFRIPLIMTNL